MGQLLRFPERRRRHPRVGISQPVALVHENATVVTATAVNISLGGMQVHCDRYTADSLHASGNRLGPGRGPRMDAHFRLPVNYGLAKVDVECRLAYVAPLEGDRFVIGMEFVTVDEPSHAQLEAFLTEAQALASL